MYNRVEGSGGAMVVKCDKTRTVSHGGIASDRRRHRRTAASPTRRTLEQRGGLHFHEACDQHHRGGSRSDADFSRTHVRNW